MPLSSALRFFGVWSGPMALAGFRPVDVCLQTIYGLNSGVFLSTLLHMPYPNRGVVWRSIQSVFTHLFTPLIACFPDPQDMCICMLRVVSPSPKCELFFPPEGMQIGLPRRPESPFLHKVQPGPVPKYRFFCLSACDTLCPSGCDVLKS